MSSSPSPAPAALALRAGIPVSRRAEADLRIGYCGRGADGAPLAVEPSAGWAACASIRVETSEDGRTLAAVLAFLGPGEVLVLPSVRHLPAGFGGLQRLLSELDARGASAVLLQEALRTDGCEGALLRRAAAAVAELRPVKRPRPGRAVMDQARALAAQGVAPGEIARTLKVSRMTVWRWLQSRAPRAAE